MSELNPSDGNCPICNYPGISHKIEYPLLYTVECPRCGRFNISEHLFGAVAKTRPNFCLSGLSRNMWENDGTPISMSIANYESVEAFLANSPIPIPNENDIPAKADFVLRHIRRKSTFPGSTIAVKSIADCSLGFCTNSTEMEYLIDYLETQKYISVAPPDHLADTDIKCKLTPTGWAYLTGIGADAKEQGFIAMAFSIPTADLLYTDGLFPGIKNAGYAPIRIDRKVHNNRIDDEIVAEIRKSRFVVADLTNNNAGAYFEAGFAQGLGKPVIWTCKKSQLKANEIHFDVRQYIVTTWETGSENLADFAKHLALRIGATIGRGRCVPQEFVNKESSL
jgi:hypothetical protein